MHSTVMFSRRSRYLVGGGFAAVMLLVLALILTGYQQLSRNFEHTDILVRAGDRNTSLLISMYTAVRERSVIIMQLLTSQDAFFRDEQSTRFTLMGSQYLVAEEAFVSSLRDAKVRELYLAHRKLAGASAPVQNRILAFLNEGRDDEAGALLFSEGFVAQNAVFKSLEALLDLVEQQTLASIQQSAHDYRRTLHLLLALGALAIIAVGAIGVGVVRTIGRADDARFAQVALQSIGDAVITVGAAGRVNYANEKARKLVDATEKQVTGRPVGEVFRCQTTVDLFATDMPLADLHECELTTFGGETKCISYTVSPIYGETHERIGSVLVFRDISEHKDMEQQLRVNQERFSLIMRGTRDGIWDYNLNTGEMYFSPRWKEMLGYREHELKESFQEWQRHIHTEDLGMVLDVWTECMEGNKESFAIEYRVRARDGELKWVECRGTVLLDERGIPVRLAGSHSDITERKQSEEQLLWHSSHDPLTGLLNRREFEIGLDCAIRQLRRSDREHALLYVDLDQFKVVNDTCGHVAGDELLRQLSRSLSDAVRSSDMLARLGGDEFGVLLNGCPAGKAKNVARHLLDIIRDLRFAWDNKTFQISASIGLVAVNASNASRDEVMSAADVACYNAKDLGRNRIHIYQESDDQLAVRHREMRWVSKISRALEEGRFVLYQQVIQPVRVAPDRPPHREILVRMLDEKGSVVPPGMFIPAAERYNLMSSIDRWVITRLFRHLAEQGEEKTNSQACISTVNLSGTSLNEPGFSDFIREQFRTWLIDPGSICFEITETSAISNLSQATVFIEDLKKLGCLFALDDFGSGLSSFGYLKNLPVDFLKIDGLFVKDMVEDPIDAAMVRSINEIGQVMGMQTIAEFVENDSILAKLAEIRVDYAQGYGIAAPQPLTTISETDLQARWKRTTKVS